ncbi:MULTISPECIES: sigma-E processing peptidase SpoIIGA [unclassified Blautia]|uniref:sigma-E processing peptidase SpoIIGA n=1 Tax=unclassified Blautia TaxID=2648079 RepID=UPI000B38137A|nr:MULTISPECIES: sigma-E processing peptidase SpoIIGA [unclassified Blautia]OUN32033.1 hypothetical protein B5G33_01335 [Blautia sp. An81]OUN94938.1 hypothetical protein B5G00_01080 [Blautia sp. An46]HJD38314.1 sigma-E processing peptidase SpoIIGA [Candidatus Blautia ornithocaccae]
MYYEFYIDVFFVVNLFMDFLVLCLTNRILRGSAKPWRALLGALAGALGISLFFWLSKEINTVNILIFSIGMSFAMVWLDCRPCRGKELLAGVLACWGISFLLGGLLYALPPRAGKGILIFFTITFTAYWILNTGIRLFKYLKGKAVLRCRVILETGGQKIELKGLLDTGNCLTDTDTGKPVCVMEKSRFSGMLEKKQQDALESFCAMEDFGEGDAENLKPRFLIYTALGCERGLLPVVTADRLVIFWEGKKICLSQAAIGLSDAPLSPYGKFEIIISPKILDS